MFISRESIRKTTHFHFLAKICHSVTINKGNTLTRNSLVLQVFWSPKQSVLLIGAVNCCIVVSRTPLPVQMHLEPCKLRTNVVPPLGILLEAIRMQGNDVNIFVAEFEFWNLDFHISPGAIFQEARIKLCHRDKEHKSSRQLFEQ